MANVIYNTLKEGLFKGDVSFDASENNKIGVLLVGSTYSSKSLKETDKFSNIKTGEITDSDYVRQELGAYTVDVDTSSTVDADDKVILKPVSSTLSFGNEVTITASGAVLFFYTGDTLNEDSGTPICYIDFDGEKSSSQGTFQIKFSEDGILHLKQS